MKAHSLFPYAKDTDAYGNLKFNKEYLLYYFYRSMYWSNSLNEWTAERVERILDLKRTKPFEGLKDEKIHLFPNQFCTCSINEILSFFTSFIYSLLWHWSYTVKNVKLINKKVKKKITNTYEINNIWNLKVLYRTFQIHEYQTQFNHIIKCNLNSNQYQEKMNN